eukprot:UN02907
MPNLTSSTKNVDIPNYSLEDDTAHEVEAGLEDDAVLKDSFDEVLKATNLQLTGDAPKKSVKQDPQYDTTQEGDVASKGSIPGERKLVDSSERVSTIVSPDAELSDSKEKGNVEESTSEFGESKVAIDLR